MRKRRAEKRFIKPDPKFNDVTLAKFINYMMWDGKKSTSRQIIYDSFELVEKKTKKSAIDVFKKIKAPKTDKLNYGARHYFKDEDFPDELKTDSKNIDEKGVLTTGGREIEFIRTIGVLVQAVRELTDKVETLEAKN